MSCENILSLNGDDLLRVASFLDAVSIAKFAACNRYLRATLEDRMTARWVVRAARHRVMNGGANGTDAKCNDENDVENADGEDDEEMEEMEEMEDEEMMRMRMIRRRRKSNWQISANVGQIEKEADGNDCWTLERLHVCESPPRFVDLRFPFGNARLVPQGNEAGRIGPVDAVVEFMRAHPSAKLHVRGHTQPNCPRSIGLSISAERARVACQRISQRLVCDALKLDEMCCFGIDTFNRSSCILFPDGSIERRDLVQRTVDATVAPALRDELIARDVVVNTSLHFNYFYPHDDNDTDEDEDYDYEGDVNGRGGNGSDASSGDGDDDDDDDDDDEDSGVDAMESFHYYEDDMVAFQSFEDDIEDVGVTTRTAAAASADARGRRGNVTACEQPGDALAKIDQRKLMETISAVEARFVMRACGNAHPRMVELGDGVNRRAEFEVFFLAPPQA